MSEVVDRVARALCKRDGEKWEALPARTAGKPHRPVDRAYYRALARVAIGQLRQPTEAMENVGYNSRFFREGTQPGSLDWRPDLIYSAMIDEALK